MKGFRVSRKKCFLLFSARNVYSQQHGDKEKHSWRCDGVYGVEVFMSCLFIWDAYVVVDIVGQWMTMWQESCQAKCGRRKSRCGAEEGWIAKQISGGRFGFWGRGGKDFF
jgi:hypothetical protein